MKMESEINEMKKKPTRIFSGSNLVIFMGIDFISNVDE